MKNRIKEILTRDSLLIFAVFFTVFWFVSTCAGVLVIDEIYFEDNYSQYKRAEFHWSMIFTRHGIVVCLAHHPFLGIIPVAIITAILSALASAFFTWLDARGARRKSNTG